jgi:branched-chain amino acid transport system permease protein
MVPQLIIYALALGSVYALVSVGFALVFNVLKFSNFSHGGIMVVTAYIGYLAARNLNTNLFLTLLISASAGGILAVLVEFFGFRRLRKGNRDIILYFVSTVTIGVLLGNLISIYFSSTFYSYPSFFKTPYFDVLGERISKNDTIMFAISVVGLAVLMYILYRTKLGIAIRAISMDFTTTGLMGVNATLVIVATFFVSGVFAGLAGVFLGISYILTPQLGNMVVKGFIASVLGGLGNLPGAIIGAFILAFLETLFAYVQVIGAGLSPVVIFIIMLVFLLLRPQGIMGKVSEQKA